MPTRRPPRLARALYVGYHRIFFTMCTFDRQELFTRASVVQVARCELLRTAAENDVAIVAYSFMPDHLHGLVAGTSEHADGLRFLTVFRQRSGRDYKRENDGRLWQEGFVDQHLRDDEATFDVMSYIVANPVRAGLCRHPKDYPYSGSSRYTLDELSIAVQWRPSSLG